MELGQRLLEIGKEKQILRDKIQVSKYLADAAIFEKNGSKALVLLDQCGIYHRELQVLHTESEDIYKSWGI